MYLDKRVEYLQPHIGAISQTLVNIINTSRDRSDMHRAMFGRFADNNFSNNTIMSTLCMSIAAIHNVVTQKTNSGQSFNFQEEVENSCRYCVQLMYYNYIIHDSVIASYADQEMRMSARQYFDNYRSMMEYARNLASFEDVQRPNVSVGYNNNGNNPRPIVIGNSNGPISGNSQFPNINMGGTRYQSDTDLSDDLAQLGSTIKKKDPVIEAVHFSPASHAGFIDTVAKQPLQQQVVQQPTPIINKVKELEYVFGESEMNRSEHRLVVGGNEFVVPVHTADKLVSDVYAGTSVNFKDDSVINDSNPYLRRLLDTCTSMNDLVTMVKSTHLEMQTVEGTKSMVTRFIGSHFDVLPTRTDVKKYFDLIVNSNLSVNKLNERLNQLSDRLSSSSSDIPELERDDVLTLLLFVDKKVTDIINSQLEFIFGKGKISIDSFIDDWGDLSQVVNNDYHKKSNEFYAAIENKLKATLLSVEVETYDAEDAKVHYTHLVSQHIVISMNVNSKFLGLKCDGDWLFVDSKKHPHLFKLINSCRSLATSAGEFTVHNTIVTNDLVVYEVDTMLNGSCWIRLMNV